MCGILTHISTVVFEGVKDDPKKPPIRVKKIVPPKGKIEGTFPPEAPKSPAEQEAGAEVQAKAQGKGKRKLTAEEIVAQEKQNKEQKLAKEDRLPMPKFPAEPILQIEDSPGVPEDGSALVSNKEWAEVTGPLKSLVCVPLIKLTLPCKTDVLHSFELL